MYLIVLGFIEGLTMEEKRMHKYAKNIYIRTARELCYSEEVIERLKKAETDSECNAILRSARKGTLK